MVQPQRGLLLESIRPGCTQERSRLLLGVRRWRGLHALVRQRLPVGRICANTADAGAAYPGAAHPRASHTSTRTTGNDYSRAHYHCATDDNGRADDHCGTHHYGCTDDTQYSCADYDNHSSNHHISTNNSCAAHSLAGAGTAHSCVTNARTTYSCAGATAHVTITTNTNTSTAEIDQHCRNWRRRAVLCSSTRRRVLLQAAAKPSARWR
jgi:hypothetical protein